MGKTVYIFGAGASIAAGIPIQNQLLANIFTSVETESSEGSSFLEEPVRLPFTEFNTYRKHLADFIINYFGDFDLQELYKNIFSDQRKRVSAGDLEEETIFKDDEYDDMWEELFTEVKKINISLENIFTILDKVILSNNFFGHESEKDIKYIQEALNKCIIYILTAGMDKYSDDQLYKRIANYFSKKRMQNEDFSLISLNWDTLLDKYLNDSAQISSDGVEEDLKLDYCLYNYDLNGEVPSIQLRSSGFLNIKLIKLHGSTNWLICNNCGRLYTNYSSDISISTLNQENSEIKCDYCESIGRNYKLLSSLVTPTFLKDFESIHYKTIWHNAHLELSEAAEIVFIGYSFPEADFELRYLLKKSLQKNAEIKVVLHESDDPDFYRDSVNEKLIDKLDLPQNRYQSFFNNHIKVEFDYRGIEGYFDDLIE